VTKPRTLKPAPVSVPVEAAYFLDKAAEELSRLAQDEGLKLTPYESHEPNRLWWVHGVYGKSRDREICVQLVTTETLAPIFAADLKAYVRMHGKSGGEIIYPLRDNSSDWLLLEKRRVDGMTELVTGVAEMTDILRLACVWRLPHPTDPDPKT
jgi:hypothetical protein